MPVATIAEFVTYVKSRNGDIDYGSPGIGGPHHLAMERFKQLARLDIKHVPYRGSSGAAQDIVDGDVCDQYAYRQGRIDWQIWISARPGRPLPRKLVITNRADEARPQSVSLIEWNPKPGFASSVFAFRPPPGAKAIEMLQRKAK